ncbi:antibiotic biosynthesis monooxygenase family protein [Amycolatopsis sp. NPDC051903]|uniref:antibiotic biosynthesis monooxygenase family protein n=1 Tax=Amycolatopsis sp. NPDC051903 TaxID=3363936 RepID=UPI0037977766
MNEKGITLINAFEIPADEIDAFVEQWRERAKLMRDAPGFRDTRLHRAKLADARFQLVNVAHWDSVEAWQAATENPAFRTSVGTVSSAVTANPALYDVVAEY